jgi:hypothetical protein
MVNVYSAYTEPVNPQGASPIRTLAQIWAGLERRVRRLHDFHKSAATTEVIEDSGNYVKRQFQVQHSGNPHLPSEVLDVTMLYPPVKATVPLLIGNIAVKLTIFFYCRQKADWIRPI